MAQRVATTAAPKSAAKATTGRIEQLFVRARQHAKPLLAGRCAQVGSECLFDFSPKSSAFLKPPDGVSAGLIDSCRPAQSGAMAVKLQSYGSEASDRIA